MLSSEVRRFHGDNLLWLGCHTPTAENVRRCMVRNRFYAAIPGSCPSETLTNFAASAQHLPLPKSAMDAVVVHHALECANDPRQAIREVGRVLAPGGRLVLCGFNPLSGWGAANMAQRISGVRRGDASGGIRLVTKSRLLDWLAVLGFELDAPVRFAGYGLGWRERGQGIRDWMQQRQLPFASAFLLSAVKQTHAVRPTLADSHLSAGKLAPVAYPKLASWNRLDDTADRGN